MTRIIPRVFNGMSEFGRHDGTAYELHGAAGAPLIVLIHGLGLCRHLWEDHIDALCTNHRVLSYDLWGHGQSAPLPEAASLTVYAQQLAGLMNALDTGPAAIVGFSIGGMINRRFALDFPELVTDLVILNSPHDRGDAAQTAVEDRAAKVREQGAFATFDAALARWFTPEFRAANPAVMDLVRDWRGLVDAESYAQAAWILANGVRELIRPDPRITARTLVMTCQADSGSTPAMSHAITREIEGAETLIIPHLQHLGLMENPWAFTSPILKFLEGTMP